MPTDEADAWLADELPRRHARGLTQPPAQMLGREGEGTAPACGGGPSGE